MRKKFVNKPIIKIKNAMNDNLLTSAIWQELTAKREAIKTTKTSSLFSTDKNRFDNFSIKHKDFLFDYSKNKVDQEVIDLLLKLTNEAKLAEWMDKMRRGEKINHTEDRAVLHIALRSPKNASVFYDNKNVIPKVHKVLDQMRQFIHDIHSGSWTGYTGKKIDTIVNIGIGGSDLGPVLTSQALQPYWQHHVEVLFVSNLDAAQLALSLANLNPETTLFIVASKSFTTLETIYEAQSAREWFLNTAGKKEHIKKHFVALSTNTEKVTEFGIDPKNMFEFWDWVGGRYSVWSCIGLSTALAIGMENFEAMLAGAHDMDEHFFNAPFAQNMPVIHALIGIWHRNFCHYSSKAVLPYDSLLYQLPSYLQQLEMESNGKNIMRDGLEAPYKTCPVIWGGSGSNGQHAFFQFLHQGTDIVPIDFIASIKNHYQIREHQALLFSNLLAQSEALMNGRDLSSKSNEDHFQTLLNNNRSFKGSIPSTTILIEQLTPFNLGSLLAFYEHSIFAQGAIWNINSFDQWGVELGKELASQLGQELLNKTPSSHHDASTLGLMEHYLKVSKNEV